MDGLELFLLGRKLMKIGENALPQTGFRQMPASMRSVMIDIFDNPDTGIQEIARRTGFPQSHVSTSVARLREAGVVVTTTDPADRRRTLARRAERITAVAEDVRANAPIDEAVAAALGGTDPDRINEVVTLLDQLAPLLHAGPDHPGRQRAPGGRPESLAEPRPRT